MRFLIPFVLIAFITNSINLCTAQDTAAQASFRIKKQDSCTATIHNISGGKLPYILILAADKIETNDCYDCRIHGFDMKIIVPNNKDSSRITIYHSTDDRLTKEMEKVLTKLDNKKVFQNRVITFCNIVCRRINSKTTLPVNDIIILAEPPPLDEHWPDNRGAH